MKQTVTISEEDGVVRIDKFIAARFPEYSRSALAKLFDLKLIKRAGEPLRAGEKVRPGTEVEYDLWPLQAKPEVIDLPVLYEDDNVVVVDKPAGIISHARGKFWQEASVASFIRDKVTGIHEKKVISEAEDTGPVPDRAGIVHRLDRATSGVMVCAKNVETLKYLQKQFHDRKVTKVYFAIITGTPKHPEATIDAAIARDLNDPKRFMVRSDGKQAMTDYIVIKSSDKYSLLKLTPKTGRTHQLRLHLKHIGKVIVGDDLYDGEPAPRLMLHAQSITIQLPGGKETTFTSDLPTELTEYVD